MSLYVRVIVVTIVVALGGCARTRLKDLDAPLGGLGGLRDFNGQAGMGPSSGEDPGGPGPGTGATGATGAAGSVAGANGAGRGGGGPDGGRGGGGPDRGRGGRGGDTGRGGTTGSGGAGSVAGAPAPVAGQGGAGASGGEGARGGTNVLNPVGCSSKPFVLTIQPSGDRGSVSGWLESTPTLSFEDLLPRFDPTPAETDLALWWSIGSTGEGGVQPHVYFYGENAVTRVAVAEGARDFSQIDRSGLVFGDWETRPVFPGEIVVFENLKTGLMLALRLDAVYDSNPNVDDVTQCAGIDASWSFTF